MSQQFKNHARYVPLYHLMLYPLLLLILISSTIKLFGALSRARHLNTPLILVAMSISLILIAFFARSFSLKTQDRAIRSEENLRSFVLTGKLLDPRLRLGQIIALRFASDHEFPGLCREAAEKNLDPKVIKKSILNWRADNHRV